MGNNYFDFNLSPFLGFHPVFNVDLLWPYFPPLLDTPEIAEELKPIELNPNYLEQESSDQIMDTLFKGTLKQRIHLYRVFKAG
jgi:hypothetical protein